MKPRPKKIDEESYIRVSNLQRTRAALSILKDVMPGVGVNGAELNHIRHCLDTVCARLEYLVMAVDEEDEAWRRAWPCKGE